MNFKQTDRTKIAWPLNHTKRTVYILSTVLGFSTKILFCCIFYFYRDNLLSFTISSAMFMIHFEMFTGGWSWHGIIGDHLCSSCRLMHVRADDYDQKADGQMDHGGVNLLLLFVHCITILSRILHFNPNGHCFGSWRCSHVECQMYIPVASKYKKRP